MINVIGLFGTCGASTWRDKFIETYTEQDIKFFNPQLPEGTWHPGCIKEENDHLMQDGIILFPVLAETTGQGSLAEIGFSISASLRRNPDRYFVFLIDDDCTDVKASPDAIADSIRSRKLVKSKLVDVQKKHSGVFMVNTMEEMLTISLELKECINSFSKLRNKYHAQS